MCVIERRGEKSVINKATKISISEKTHQKGEEERRLWLYGRANKKKGRVGWTNNKMPRSSSFKVIFADSIIFMRRGERRWYQHASDGAEPGGYDTSWQKNVILKEKKGETNEWKDTAWRGQCGGVT